MTELDKYSIEINKLCKTHKVKSLYAFGSVVSGNLKENSDIDFVVDFEAIHINQYADNYYDLKFSLQDIFQKRIDLLDIFNAINEIENFFVDGDKSFIAYQNDLRTRRAVERNIEIIGEALNRILQRNDMILLSNSRKIVDTRNRIIHGYDTVSDEIIWGIIINHLPLLKAEVELLLNE